MIRNELYGPVKESSLYMEVFRNASILKTQKITACLYCIAALSRAGDLHDA